MNTRHMDKRGFTLVELLVVIGIITILAAVAIPTLIKAGAFQKEYIDQSGRTLYNLLKAAEYYASTYNVEACVAYEAEEQLDSESGLPVIVARSLGVFRRATDPELERWADIHGTYTSPITSSPVHDEEDEGDVKVFVPVAEYELTELQPGACVLGEWVGDAATPYYADFWTDVAGYPAKGLEPVRIRTEEGPPLGFAPDPAYDGVLVAPHVDFGPVDGVPDIWPAHIFTPSGYVDTTVSQERLVMYVGATPESDPEDRFVDLNETPLDLSAKFPGYAVDYYPVPPVEVQISKSSARVKIVDVDE